MRYVLVISLVAGVAACGRGTPPEPNPDVVSLPTTITLKVGEVIRRIRPNFLRPAANTLAPTSMDLRATGRPERSLFVDGILQDRLDDLRGILAKNVVEIRLMSPADVSLVLGKEGHVFGAIAVKTKPRA